MTDPYQVLGVSPSATDEQIKNAYRELARKYHPDNYANNPLADLAQEKMKEINEAYDQIQRQRKQQSSRAGQGYSQGGYSQSGYSQSGYSRGYAGPGRQFPGREPSLRTSASCSTPTASATPKSCWRASRRAAGTPSGTFCAQGLLCARLAGPGVQLLCRANQMSPGQRRVSDRSQPADVAAQHRTSRGRLRRLPQRADRRGQRLRHVHGAYLRRHLLRVHGRRPDQLLLKAGFLREVIA